MLARLVLFANLDSKLHGIAIGRCFFLLFFMYLFVLYSFLICIFVLFLSMQIFLLPLPIYPEEQQTIRPALILYQDFEIPTKMRCSSRFHQLFTTISFIAFDFINYLILYTYFILTSHNTKLRTYLISHSQ